MNRMCVALFSNRAQAEPVQERLELAGIAADIQEELWLQKFWYVSKPAAGVSLEVEVGQFERAEQLLLAWDKAEGVLGQAVRCPECKSFRVDYPQFARNSVLTNMAAGILAELGLVEKDYYCQHCHYTWPKERTTPSRSRLHMAPYYFIEDVGKTASPLAVRQKSAPDAGRKTV